MNVTEMKNSEVTSELQSLEDEFETLYDLEDESDPLGIILAYGSSNCW